MSPRRFEILPAFALLTLAGCSTAPPKQANEPDPISMPEPAGDPSDEPVADPDPKPVDAPLSSAPSDDAPDPAADDYEINHRDCEALARAYANAWKNDEMATLEKKKLSQAQHDKIATQVQEDSQGMFDNYIDQCGKTVGTTYLRSRLQCAAKAKTMKRFDDCMDGRADE